MLLFVVFQKGNAMNYDNVELRRYEDDLNVSGKGVIIMGFWAVIKFILEILYGTNYRSAFGISDPTVDKAEQFLYFLVSFILSVLIIVLHLYIGHNAMKAATGRPYKKGYFIATILTFITLMAFMPAYAEDLKDFSHFDTTVAAILVDLTTAYLYISVIRSTHKIKKLKADKVQRET